MRICLLIAATLVVCIEVVADENSEAAADSSQSAAIPAAWKQLHDRWESAIDELEIPGVAVVVVQGNDVVLVDSFGVCDEASEQPVTPRSPFYLASVTKSFTALGIAILSEQGKVDLDAPVKKYLPAFTLADPDVAAKVTIRDLLAHRHGLNSEPITMGEAYFGNMTEQRYYGLLATVHPLGRFAYTNLHYTILGRVIEEVTGQSWKDFLAKQVFDPLEMTDATCYASQLYANPLAAWPMSVRSGQLKVAPLVKNDSVMHAAGGMGASANDLANWLRFQLTGKTPKGRQLISPELLDETHTRQSVDQRPSRGSSPFQRDGYSLGWFSGKFQERPMLQHGGGYIGTATTVCMLPEENIGVAVLVNESRPLVPTWIATDVFGKLLNEEVPDLLPVLRDVHRQRQARASQRKLDEWIAPSVDRGLTAPIDRYPGIYENDVWGNATITQRDGQLAMQVGSHLMRWHTLDEDRFRVEVTPGDVLEGEFDLDDQGQVRGLSVETPLGKSRFVKRR